MTSIASPNEPVLRPPRRRHPADAGARRKDGRQPPPERRSRRLKTASAERSCGLDRFRGTATFSASGADFAAKRNSRLRHTANGSERDFRVSGGRPPRPTAGNPRRDKKQDRERAALRRSGSSKSLSCFPKPCSPAPFSSRGIAHGSSRGFRRPIFSYSPSTASSSPRRGMSSLPAVATTGSSRASGASTASPVSRTSDAPASRPKRSTTRSALSNSR